jgi:hypothetical protein
VLPFHDELLEMPMILTFLKSFELFMMSRSPQAGYIWWFGNRLIKGTSTGAVNHQGHRGHP